MAEYEIKNGVGIIPEGAKEIVDYGFDGCADLIEVTIPNSVVKIGNQAFSDCTNLKKVVIPDTLEEMGIAPFNGCSSLQSIVIPKKVKKLGKFQVIGEGLNSLKSLSILCAANNLKDGNLFPALEELTFGVGIKKFDECFFRDNHYNEKTDAFEEMDNFPKLKVVKVPAGKADYYAGLVPEKCRGLIVEEGGEAKPAAKKPAAKPATPKKSYKLVFECRCTLAECAEILNDTGFDDLGNRIDFEQEFGKLSKKTTKTIIADTMKLVAVTDITDGEKSMTIATQPEAVEKDWVEAKLKLENGKRYYIQSFQPKGGGLFTKNVSFTVEVEKGDFDFTKLQTVIDDSFYQCYMTAYDPDTDEDGKVVGDMVENVIYDPYHILYDGKQVSGKVSVTQTLRGEAYMCFKWKK